MSSQPSCAQGRPLTLSALTLSALTLSALLSGAALARPLAVTIEGLKVSPTSKEGVAWDEDGTLPDLQVRVKSNGVTLLTSPVFTDTLAVSAPLHLTLDSEEASLEVFVFDADDLADQKISALRVRPQPKNIGVGAMPYRASNIESLRVAFEPIEPGDSERPESPEGDTYRDEGSLAEEAATPGEHSDLADAHVVDPWEGVSGYTPRPSALPALTPLDLSASRLDPALLSDEGARALYTEATRLRAAGWSIEAKELLARLIAAHPKSLYALKARRDLF